MKIIGHRGAKGLAQENTLKAIKASFALGVDEIEIDVRQTSDGVLVLVHGKPYKRLIGLDISVQQHTYNELKKLDPLLTTLDETIDFLNKRTRLRIEIKPNTPTEPIIKLVRAYLQKGWKPEMFIFASFQQSILKELYAALPEIELVVNEHLSLVRAMRRADQVRTTNLVMHHRFLWGLSIWHAKRKGYDLVPYPLNSVKKARRWKKFGLHSVITDYPDRLLILKD